MLIEVEHKSHWGRKGGVVDSAQQPHVDKDSGTWADSGRMSRGWPSGDVQEQRERSRQTL